MPAAAFVERLNEQIGHEFAAHQQYVAVAVHYDAETLPQLARALSDARLGVTATARNWNTVNKLLEMASE